jgi:hypothetical protein
MESIDFNISKDTEGFAFALLYIIMIYYFNRVFQAKTPCGCEVRPDCCLFRCERGKQVEGVYTTARYGLTTLPSIWLLRNLKKAVSVRVKNHERLPSLIAFPYDIHIQERCVSVF